MMEDIAQKTVELVDHQLVGPSYSFDIYEHFSEIGVRYGFVMDTKLIVESVSDAYRDAWLQTFKDLAMLQDVEYVDSTEECLIDLIQKLIPEQDAYFIQALKTGSLPQSWVQKVLTLLLPEKKVDEEPAATAVSRAVTEKPITRAPVKVGSQQSQQVLGKGKHLAYTRRHVAASDKKYLSKTRRAVRVQE